MKTLAGCNPIAVTVYFLSVSGILMFSQNPILLALGFVGAFAYAWVRENRPTAATHGICLLLFLILAALNPLFSHNGKTPIFVINDSPITLEACVYGVVSAGILITVFYLFGSFSAIMTRDKLLYVFGSLSPRLALILSMGLRYVPLLRDRAGRIVESQRALGLYKEDNIIDRIKSDLRVFSILITWALENGITTADSMAARGYGTHRRSFYARFRLRGSDVCLLLVTLACSAMTVIGMAFGALDFAFYPALRIGSATPLSIAAYTAYGILAALPIILETEACVRWKYLQSKI